MEKKEKREKKVKLRDGTEVLIRDMRPGDVDRSLAFFQKLPKEDRAYLRQSVITRENVKQRIAAIKSGSVMRLAAVVGGEIVADGALEFEGHSWKAHVGEMRLIVAHEFQRRGLGTLMARELYLLANAKKVEEIIIRIMKPQMWIVKVFERLGFHKEAELHDYVKDIEGHKQDLILMRCNLDELWAKMEYYLTHSDWRRAR